MTKEEQVLLDAVNAYLNNERISIKENIDWNLLIELSLSNGVLDALKRIKNLPKKSNNDIREHHLKTEREMVKQVVALEKEFKKKGIEPIFWKGVILEKKYYTSDFKRYSGDIDILVKEKDFLKAEKILKIRNYKIYAQAHSKSWYLKHHFHIIYHNLFKTPVELHWDIFHEDDAINRNRNEYWENTDNISLAGKKVKEFNPEYSLLSLCAHFMTHKMSLDTLHYLDIALIIKKSDLNWKNIILSSKKWHISTYVYHILKKVEKNFNIAIPPEVLKELRKDSSQLKLRVLEKFSNKVVTIPNTQRTVLEQKIMEILLPYKFHIKLSFLFNDIILGAFFPPKQVIAEHYHLKESSPWVYPCYLLNPFRIAIKSLSALTK